MEINSYLRTKAKSLPELVEELGNRQFGQRPSVGDCFCGGGSVPFEAARIGCDVFASDLNPVAVLLTWAALNIIGGGEEIVESVKKAQKEVYEAVDKQIIEWGIEHNEKGWRADAYIYCCEVICPECGWKIPLLPTMIISEYSKVIAKLEPISDKHCYDIRIVQDASIDEINSAEKAYIVDNSRVICPNHDCQGHKSPIPLSNIRRDHEGLLRLWEKDDIVPRSDDIFQERLYCIRWVESHKGDNGQEITKKHYLEPDDYDLENEKRVLALLKKHFSDWQEKGYIPSMSIEGGYNTNQPIHERGWTYWNHLFTPRQLIFLALFSKTMSEFHLTKYQKVSILLSIGKCCDWNSKLSRWHNRSGKEGTAQTFYNQALNTVYNFASRGTTLLSHSFFIDFDVFNINTNVISKTLDAASIEDNNIFWVTDPPYADAINYHELSEFFLAWYGQPLKELFSDWYIDSKRSLTIKGSDEEFRKSMVEVYSNLTKHMPDNGAQVVMFTHRDANVWADLSMILWASGLQVTAAWCVATETDTSIRSGNYVQGTVLVLRKRKSHDTVFLDEIYPEVEEEVKKQLSSMLAIDNKEDPNFGDTDYQLAAYAAALRVLTRFKQIEDIDIERELIRVRDRNEKNPLEAVIRNAVKIACDYLVPTGIHSCIWKQLLPEERFYLKGLELESHGEYRIGAYQELARGFGIREYKNLQKSGKANETRLKTASEFRDRDVGGEGFSSSLVRNILFAIRQTRQEDDTAAGKVWLREYPGYWEKRKEIKELLNYFATLGINDSTKQWKEDSEAARLLTVVVDQDHL